MYPIIDKKTNENFAAAMEKIEKAIASDPSLDLGFFREFQNTTRPDNKCSRTYRALVEVRILVPTDS